MSLIVYKLIIFLFLPNANFKLTGLLRRICDAPRKDGARVRSLRSFALSNVFIDFISVRVKFKSETKVKYYY